MYTRCHLRTNVSATRHRPPRPESEDANIRAPWIHRSPLTSLFSVHVIALWDASCGVCVRILRAQREKQIDGALIFPVRP